MSTFTRDMAIEAFRNSNDACLHIPCGVTKLAGDFALLYNWPADPDNCHFRKIIIPASVEEINGIFVTEYSTREVGADKFKAIEVDKENNNYCSVDGVLFTKDMKVLLRFPCGKMKEKYYVPEGVETIAEGAFLHNVFLKQVILAQTVRHIENFAFSSCEHLESITFSESLDDVGYDCFSNSNNIRRLKLPSGMKWIPSSIFDSVGVIEIPDSISEIKYDDIPTDWLDLPFMDPVILTKNNSLFVDFAETYDYNHFENYVIDDDGIIWSEDKQTLINFPPEYDGEIYRLPKYVKSIFVRAFKRSNIKYVISDHVIEIIGRGPEKYNIQPGRVFYVDLIKDLKNCKPEDIPDSAKYLPAENTNNKNNNSIFISYRRDRGEALAYLLYNRLTAEGYDCFLDVESLRSGMFNVELYKKNRTVHRLSIDFTC